MIDTIQLQLLLATFAAWANRRQGSVIAYLVEENRILKEQFESGGRRLRFTDDQRRRLAVGFKDGSYIGVVGGIAIFIATSISLATYEGL